jgi:uncharacterized OB-fold protein
VSRAAEEPLPKPVPEPTPETEAFWEGCAAGELRIQACEACGAYSFFPTIACQACHGPQLAWKTASGRGEVVTYTVVQRAMGAFSADAPFTLAIVRLAEGPQLMSRLVDADRAQLRAGMPVAVTFETRGDQSLPVFRPA